MKMLRPKDDANIDFRFVYYAMKCIQYEPQDHTRHWISKYSLFKIPIPPMDEQKRIVDILDKFTKLEEELEEELEERKKQYEYYRNTLLLFDSGDKTRQVKYVPLSDVFEIKNGYTPSKINSKFLGKWNFTLV
jgi:type I restriction enzyme S subunit